ncbi:MAG: DUF3568 family protein [Verrucomicrobia bacterium]|nr:DUF3568 family protein [Verrucomicrobiota bacterium]
MRRMLPFFLGMVVLAGTAGCVGLAVGAAAGAGGYAYYKGELKSAEGYPLDAVWEATQKAVRRLELVIEESARDALEAKLDAKSAAGKKIHTRLKRLGERATELRIRVGVLGDKTLSRQIRDAILGELKASTAPSTGASG